MKNRKLVATLLSLTMMAGLGVNSLAASDSTTIKVAGKVNEAKISVAWPKPTLVINPYGMAYKVSKDATDSSTIVSAPSNLVNKADFKVKMTGAVKTTTNATQADAESEDDTVKNGFELKATDAAVTGDTKCMSLQLNMLNQGQVANSDVKKVDAVTALATKLESAEDDAGVSLALSLTESGDGEAIEAFTVPAGDKAGGKSGVVTFWFSGKANGDSKYAWTKTDTVTAEIALKLAPIAADSSTESSAYTPTADLTSSVTFAAGNTALKTAAITVPEGKSLTGISSVTLKDTTGQAVTGLSLADAQFGVSGTNVQLKATAFNTTNGGKMANLEVGTYYLEATLELTDDESSETSNSTVAVTVTVTAAAG